ncbi:MAG TPA: selenium metabolism-associated LysR family transcriptional regulator [Thermodesulfovibrionales bacterium]|nr:selenium metabolism-associated LysR family transcriptional regulator [Thermodesulfovibrionales bacterium]
MDIHHLRVFASVFKHKSFSKASEELHLTQPTVSDHIKALEGELNCRLFDRLSRKIIPTKEAGVLIGRASEIIEKVEGIQGLLGEFRKELSGHLILGASTIPATYILPGLTASYRKKHPGVFFEIVVSDSRGIIDKVAGHDLLAGVVGAKLDNGQVHYSPFLDDELVAIAAPSFTTKKGLGLREIAALPMVMREEGSGTRREFEKILVKDGIDPHQLSIVGLFGSTDAVKQAVKEGMGISIISRRAVRDELRCKLLREIRITDAAMTRHFFIVTHKKRTLPHLYKGFLGFLLPAA